MTPLAPSPTLTQPIAQATTAELAQRSRAKEAATAFEAQFLSSMLQQMFSGVETDGPFGGGFGEEMFRSVMTEAMAKQMTKAGGVGVADTIQRELLKLQGLQ